MRRTLIAMGVAALAGCGEIVPIERDGAPVHDAVPAPDAVAADNANLASLDLGAFGDVLPAFDPAQTSYTASFSLLVQRLPILARPVNPDATIAINGVAVAPGQRSDGVSLAADSTAIDIEVQAPAGNRKTYRIVATRDASIRQYVYGKASNPGAGRLPRSELETIVPGDELGFWMDISGDTLVVGAHLEDSEATGVDGDQENERSSDSGAAYVFRREDNAWQQEAYLKASNTGAGDDFGRAVAIDGDVIAVGAPFEASDASGIDGDQDSDALESAGAVYIFRRTGAQWRQEAYIKPSNPLAGALFGLQVALGQGVLVVGAPGMLSLDPEETRDDDYPNQGTAYVFRHDGVTWVEEAILAPSSSRPGDQFGFQVGFQAGLQAGDADADIIAVSAIGDASGIGGDAADPDDASAPMSGAVYIFERQDGMWRQTDYLKAPEPGGAESHPGCVHVDTCEGDRFGVRLALDGDTLVVGAHLEDSSAREIDGDHTLDDEHNAGAAWVFRRGDDGDFAQEAYLKPTNLDTKDFFGQNFALAGDLLAVAANGESSGSTGVGQDDLDNRLQSAGAVYLFRRTGVTWQQVKYIKASNTDAFDNFGFNVVMSFSTLVVGALWESGGVPGIGGDADDNGAPASGAFYVFQ